MLYGHRGKYAGQALNGKLLRLGYSAVESVELERKELSDRDASQLDGRELQECEVWNGICFRRRCCLRPLRSETNILCSSAMELICRPSTV